MGAHRRSADASDLLLAFHQARLSESTETADLAALLRRDHGISDPDAAFDSERVAVRQALRDIIDGWTRQHGQPPDVAALAAIAGALQRGRWSHREHAWFEIELALLSRQLEVETVERGRLQ